MTEPTAAATSAPRHAWAVAAGGLALRMLALTWRIREVNGDVVRRLRADRQPIIFAFWHGRMLALLWKHRNEGASVLISEHKDGELVARAALALGYRTVRGSSFRGAERALLGMIRVVESGGDVAFTPDGPRGPAETFAPGALIVAQRTGAPIVLVTSAARRAWRLRSWDGFRIPKPFARVTIAYGDPLYITSPTARAASDEAPRVQALLRELTARIDG